MAWIYDPSDYEVKEFSIIPVGDYRARITDVTEKTFRSGSTGYEVIFEVAGHGGRLWYYLVLDPSDTKKTNQRIGVFFESFGIKDPDLSHYRSWIGKVGGVRVRHEDYKGSPSAKVAFCISKKNQEKLPEAKFNTAAATENANNATAVDVNEDDLPF